MAFLAVEDRSASMEVVVFPATYRSEQAVLKEDAVVLICGETDVREDVVQLRAERVIPIGDAMSRLCKRLGVTFPVQVTSEDILFRVKDIVQRHSGEIPLSLIFTAQEGERWIVRPGTGLAVAPTGEMLEELRALVGDERILVDCG